MDPNATHKMLVQEKQKTLLESFNDCQLNRVYQGTGEGHKKWSTTKILFSQKKATTQK